LVGTIHKTGCTGALYKISFKNLTEIIIYFTKCLWFFYKWIPKIL
jgi:hypothetical protein